jgi:pimeloyl-ACP methyl ester carboxylesterase
MGHAFPEEMSAKTRHRRARIDGVRLHWVEMGDGGSATPVVLLHGLYDWHRTWKQVDEALAHDRRVLLLDLPGHGLSGRPDASYALAWYARVVARWISALGLEQVDVVGHSFGGGVAQMLLLECPDRIRRLVLVASGGLGREIRPVLRLASVPVVVETFGQPFMSFGTRLALRTGCGFSRKDIEELARMNGKPGSARAFARTVRDIIDWRGQRRAFFERVHEVGKLPPIAVFWGDRDKIIPIAHGQTFVESLDGVVFVTFERCGHYLHREQPDVFARALREFLDAPRVPAAKVRPTSRSPRSPRSRARFLAPRGARGTAPER